MGWDIVKQVRLLVEDERPANLLEMEDLMLKARGLIEAHARSLLTVKKTVNSDDPIEVNRWASSFWVADAWRYKLASASAGFLGARAVMVRQGNRYEVAIAGRESTRAAWFYTHKWLVSHTYRLGRRVLDFHAPRVTSSKSRQLAGKLVSYRIFALWWEADSRAREEMPIMEEALALLTPHDKIRSRILAEIPQERPRYASMRDARPKTAEVLKVLNEPFNHQITNLLARGT